MFDPRAYNSKNSYASLSPYHDEMLLTNHPKSDVIRFRVTFKNDLGRHHLQALIT